MVTTTKYMYFGNQYVGETDDAGTVTKRYVNEPDQYTRLIGQHDELTGDNHYHHYDAIGSTREVTDETETVTDEFTYDAWGNRLSRTGTNDTPFQYVGEHGYYREDATESYYVMARTYQPSIARWWSADPLGYIDGLNRFLYGKNNAPIFIDVSGFNCCVVNSFKVKPDKVCSLRKANDEYPISYGMGFSVEAKFSNNNPAVCGCCEYRQYLTDYSFLRFRHYQRVNGKVRYVKSEEPIFSTTIEELVEDVDGKGDRYGHRSDSNRKHDIYRPGPRNSACGYKSTDFPSFGFNPQGQGIQRLIKESNGQNFLLLEMKRSMRFVLNIIDECQGGVVDTRVLDIDCCAFLGVQLVQNNGKEQAKLSLVTDDDPNFTGPPCGT